MKKYESPVIEVLMQATEDIMQASLNAENILDMDGDGSGMIELQF